MTYASDTTVTSERSRGEIERILTRYKASQFMYGWDKDRAVVGFMAQDRQVRFVVPMPDRNDRDFLFTPARRQRRNPQQVEAAYEQAVRQRWRALALVIKAKLEAVEAGITTFDSEFLAQLVLPDGQTVGDSVIPRIADAYQSHTMPSLLPDYQKAIEA